MLWSAHCRTPGNDTPYQVVFYHRQASVACLQYCSIFLESLFIHLGRLSVDELYQERRGASKERLKVTVKVSAESLFGLQV